MGCSGRNWLPVVRSGGRNGWERELVMLMGGEVTMFL